MIAPICIKLSAVRNLLMQQHLDFSGAGALEQFQHPELQSIQRHIEANACLLQHHSPTFMTLLSDGINRDHLKVIRVYPIVALWLYSKS